jgi:hypothetical protein
MLITSRQRSLAFGKVRSAKNAVSPDTDMLLGLLAASRQGEFAAVDPTLERLLGRSPRSMRDVLAARLTR